MKARKTILVTSCKGGIGKSTVTLNLGAALAERGLKVLIIDFDLANRCLDLFSGHENDIVYDFGDVYLGRLSAERAVIQCGFEGRLMLCAAPCDAKIDISSDITEILRTFEKIIDASDAEYVIIDCSGSDAMPSELSAKLADSAIIVTSHQPAAIRAAEHTGFNLYDSGITEIRLIVNFFDCASVKKGERRGIIEIIDGCRIQIIGAVPYDKSLEIAQEKGINALQLKKSDAGCAFRNIAARICGKNVPLFYGMKNFSKRKLFF